MQMTDDTDVLISRQWRPAFICLTVIPQEGVSNGQPTTCFVDPLSICTITRSLGNYTGNPSCECTTVMLYHNMHLLVTQHPEEVNLLRNAALGYHPKIDAVEALYGGD